LRPYANAIDDIECWNFVAAAVTSAQFELVSRDKIAEARLFREQ
jgi:hypothetical protein